MTVCGLGSRTQRRLMTPASRAMVTARSTFATATVRSRKGQPLAPPPDGSGVFAPVSGVENDLRARCNERFIFSPMHTTGPARRLAAPVTLGCGLGLSLCSNRSLLWRAGAWLDFSLRRVASCRHAAYPFELTQTWAASLRHVREPRTRTQPSDEHERIIGEALGPPRRAMGLSTSTDRPAS